MGSWRVECDRDRDDPARRSSISRADDLLRGRHYVAIPSLLPPGIWSPVDFISWRVESGPRKPDRDDKFVACPGTPGNAALNGAFYGTETVNFQPVLSADGQDFRRNGQAPWSIRMEI